MARFFFNKKCLSRFFFVFRFPFIFNAEDGFVSVVVVVVVEGSSTMRFGRNGKRLNKEYIKLVFN